MVHPYSSIETTAAFYFIGQVVVAGVLLPEAYTIPTKLLESEFS